MKLQIETTPWTAAKGDWLIVGVPEGTEFAGPLAELDAALGGQLVRLREKQDLTGKPAELLALRDVPGIAAERLLLVGLGPADKLTDAVLHKAMLTAARHISTKDKQRVVVAVPAAGETIPPGWVSLIAAAMQVGAVGQDLYRAEKQRFAFDALTLLIGSGESRAAQSKLRAAADEGNILGEAVNLARELVNQPPSTIFPVSLAELATNLAKEHGLVCEVLDESGLEREKMNALMAVAQGSEQPPRLVILEHKGSKDGPVLGLCGKGVTFDSGGLSIKNTEGMLTMKCDMAGAATVLATMLAIARLKLPVHVIGLMGCVENMPSGSAFKLGDVLKARNGVTIEVHNTDAEGRLVLADVLSYAVDRGADYLIDLATLTGACVVALGEEVVGAFTNNQEWCDRVLKAAERAGEDVWQLPMHDHFAELIKSDVADIKNVGGRWGGAITAAKFLERFVGDKPWVHLDIAGPAFASGPKPHREGGGTGCMVRSLMELVRAFPTIGK